MTVKSGSSVFFARIPQVEIEPYRDGEERPYIPPHRSEGLELVEGVDVDAIIEGVDKSKTEVEEGDSASNATEANNDDEEEESVLKLIFAGSYVLYMRRQLKAATKHMHDAAILGDLMAIATQ